MNEFKIYKWPAPILEKKCKFVQKIDSKIKELLDKMCELMLEAKGIGLAANQCGLDLRLIVMQTKEKIFKLVNPQILKREGRINFIEGCLSFPGIELEIRRAKKVWVKSLDENGQPQDLELEDIPAVIIQHEIDHINGITFIKRAYFTERLKILPQLQKLKENNY